MYVLPLLYELAFLATVVEVFSCFSYAELRNATSNIPMFN